MKSKMFRAVGALSLVTAFALVGCAQTPTAEPTGDTTEDGLARNWDEVVTLAKQEGSLTLYSSDTSEQLEALAAGFEAEYGIKVEYVKLASTAVEQRFTEELRSGIVAADVIQQADPSFFNLYPSEFRKISDVGMPAAADYLDDYISDYSVAGVIFTSGLQYNTDLVSPADVPQNYDDLLDPKWKGKILFITPTASPTPLSLLQLIAAEKGEDWIKKFGQQDLQFVDSATPGGQQIASGAYAINFPTASGAQTEPLKAQGAPIDWVSFDPIQIGTNELSLPIGSPHPNAAALYLNYRISKDGWKAVCDTNPQYATPFKDGSTLDGCVTVPENVTRVDYSVLSDTAKRDHLLDLLGYQQ